MIRNLIVFLGVWLFAFSAAANSCQRRGYVFEGTRDANELPAGFTAEECKSCKSGAIYYWKCVADDEDENEDDDDEQAEDEKVNCLDYLRADDVDGFTKCTGLQGKWERRGNQLLRVE